MFPRTPLHTPITMANGIPLSSTLLSIETGWQKTLNRGEIEEFKRTCKREFLELSGMQFEGTTLKFKFEGENGWTHRKLMIVLRRSLSQSFVESLG